MEILIFNHRLVQWSVGKISIFPSKEVQEMDQYARKGVSSARKHVIELRRHHWDMNYCYKTCAIALVYQTVQFVLCTNIFELI